ncbi:MAG: ABC-2 transporter permease [Clostridia bacterium]|nr:ABC-2 transporter permease [Clostridia bacterium]
MKGLIKKELRSLRVFTFVPMFGILITSLTFLLLNFEKDLSSAISYGCLSSISYTWAVGGSSTDAGNGWLGWIGVLPVSKEQYFKAKSIGAAVAVSLVLLPQWISLAIRFCTDDDLTPLGLIPMYLALLSKAVNTVADCLPPPRLHRKKPKTVDCPHDHFLGAALREHSSGPSIDPIAERIAVLGTVASADLRLFGPYIRNGEN